MICIVILVVLILNQVEFHNARDCSTTVCFGEPCNITREVSSTEGAVVWRRDGDFVRYTPFPCTDPKTDQNYSVYCMDASVNRHYILEIYHPEYHDFSNFTDSITSDVTTLNLMVPHNLSSVDLKTNIPDTITEDIFNVSVNVPCSKPQPTFTWKFQASTSTIPYTIQNSHTSTNNVGCTSSLLNRLSSLSVDLNDWDPEITKADSNINITVEVKFCDGKPVPSSQVTVTYIAPGTSSVSPETTTDTTNGLLPGRHECYCYCLVLLIIKVVLVVVTIILVIVHFCRREAKPDGNVYWVITVGFILDGPVCFVLSIIQILYFEHIIACSQCMDKPGYDAAIAFDVCGFITSIVCIVFFWIRLKQRDQSKKVPVSTTEMNLNPEKEGNGTRPLPTPKNT